MAQNIILALCEGPHDVAFLHKILIADGFRTYQKTKLGDYPRPMNQFIIEEVKKTNINELNLQTVRSSLLPGSVLKKDENYVFLYSIGGDSKKGIRQSILKKIVSFLPEDGKYEVIPKDTTLNLVYFFDADEKGVKKRQVEVHKEIKEIFEDIDSLEESNTIEYRKMTLGVFIFSLDERDTGKLEDLIIPVMSKNNELIFEGAKEYFEKHYEELRCKSKGADIKKATIGISGQLQKSGSTNTVIISQSDYLSNDKINDSKECNEIISFFNKFIK